MVDEFTLEAKRDERLDFAAILAAAHIAAREAAAAANAALPPEDKRGFDCGFAWVDIPTPRDMDPVTKGFIRHCKTVGSRDGAGSKRGYGKAAWQFWCTGYHPTQSVSVHYAAAAAFALVLRNNGISGAHAGQRLD